MIKISAFIVFVCTILISCKIKDKNEIDTLKIELGKQLFYDLDLSYNQTKSCSSCHDPKFAFTDGYKRSIGSYGDLHQRNSKPLFNLANQMYLTAADSTIHTLEEQMNNPMFNQHPPELGMHGHESEIIRRLESKPAFMALFQKAFPSNKKKISFTEIKNAIATFLLTVKSTNSRYDRFVAGKRDVLNADEVNGMQLFFSEKTNCSNCHGGANFDIPSVLNNLGNKEFYFNTGIYNIDEAGTYPPNDIGLMQKTKQPADMGKFKVPTLRNLAFTGPYYHDGSASTLPEVIENYDRGGRIISTASYKGDGTASPLKHPFVKPLQLSQVEKKQLLFFLLALNDSLLLTNPDYQNSIPSK